jgi:hypothetical protein
MNRCATLLGMVLLLSGAGARAGELGLGVMLAEPTGLSAKLWLDPATAIDAAAAWSFSGADRLQLHGDWLLHRYDVFPGIDPYYGRLPLYFGLGARVRFNDDRRGHEGESVLGLRVPVGVSYLFARAPFDVFAEVVPILDLTPDTRLDVNAAIGGRFYFGRRDQLMR